MKKLIMVTFVILPLMLIAASAKPIPATCRIYQLSRNTIDGSGRSSYTDDIGRFTATGEEGDTIRSFNFQDKVVTAGISFDYDYSHRPDPRSWKVLIALTVSDKAEKVIFESPGSSEASTFDKKAWNLMASKSIVDGDRTYTFTLSCSQGIQLPRR